MEKIEAFSQDSTEIKEIDWVKKQVKAELLDLQKESFYSTWDDGKVNYDMEAVKKYLTTIQQKNWSDLTSKNSSAWIMAVQIALEERGIDVGKVDGIFGAGTKAAVKTFQEKNEITADGLPGPQTIAKLLEWEDKKPEWEGENPEWEGGKPKWKGGKPKWKDEKPKWGDEKPKWEDKQSEWEGGKPKWEDEKTETVTGTSEKMDLTKVNIDVLKKVYGETIDENWKGFQEGRAIIEIGGLKFKKWTEKMNGLAYQVGETMGGRNYFAIGQYRDWEQNGKWFVTFDDWVIYQWDFLNDEPNWKVTHIFPWPDWITYEWGRKEGTRNGRGVLTIPGIEKFEGHREEGKKKWRGTSIYPNGEKLTINYENDHEWKWDYIFSTGEKIYWEWKYMGSASRECTKKISNSQEPLKVKISTWLSDWIIEAISFENTIKIKVEKDYFVFQPESPRLAFPRGRKFDPFAIAHALNWAIKHVKDTLQKVDNYEFDQFEPSVLWDFVQIDRKWAALDIDLIDTRKYPGMNATKVSDWLNANAETFGLLNTKKSKAKKS